MNLNFNYNGKTLLKQWWQIVKDNFTSVQSAFNGHAAKSVIDHPDSSVTEQKLAEKSVTYEKLGDDVADYFTELEQRCKDNEVSQMHGISSLQTDLAREKAAREAGDDDIKSELDAEKAAREAADSAINERIDEFEELNNKPFALTVEEVGIAENEIDNALPGTVFTQKFSEDGNPVNDVISQIKIRRERNTECKYPDAISSTFGGSINNADIFFEQGLSGTIYMLNYGDGYEFDIINPMSVPAGSTVYFQLIEKCVPTIDGPDPRGKVRIIDVYTWHDAMYIKTGLADDYTRIAPYEAVMELSSRLKTTDSAVAALQNELGTMAAALDAVNGDTGAVS